MKTRWVVNDDKAGFGCLVVWFGYCVRRPRPHAPPTAAGWLSRYFHYNGDFGVG